MIIPPVALAIGAAVLVVKLLTSGQVDSPNDEETELKAERTESKYSHFASNCRFRSEKVPHRDLSSTSVESKDTHSVESGQPVDKKTEDPNKLMHIDEDHADQSKLQAETPEDSST